MVLVPLLIQYFLDKKNAIQLGIMLPIFLVPVQDSKAALLQLLVVQCGGRMILVITTKQGSTRIFSAA